MDRTAETQAIRIQNQKMMDYFTEGDFHKAALLCTADIDYITFNGDHLKGREEYIRTHEALMRNFMFRGARLEGEIKEIRFLNDTTAVVIAEGAIRFRWQKKVPENRKSINTNVYVKQDDQWYLTAFQNSRIKKMSGLAKWLFGLMQTKK